MAILRPNKFNDCHVPQQVLSLKLGIHYTVYIHGTVYARSPIAARCRLSASMPKMHTSRELFLIRRQRLKGAPSAQHQDTSNTISRRNKLPVASTSDDTIGLKLLDASSGLNSSGPLAHDFPNPDNHNGRIKHSTITKNGE